MRFLAIAASAAKEPTLLQELWREFIQTYFTGDAYYPNLRMGYSEVLQLKLILLGLCVGLAVAAFGAVYDKRVLGHMVRTLLRKDCLSPEQGKTLADLGYARNSIVRHSVKRSISLRRVVRCVEEEQFLAEQERRRIEHEEQRKTDKSIGRFREMPYSFDLENDHFYIPEDMKYMAEIKFEKKGNTWFGAAFFAVILLIGYVVLLVNLPNLLEILNDVAATLDPNSPKNIV